MFASVDKALDERTIGHNPERLNLLKGGIIYSNKVLLVSDTTLLGSNWFMPYWPSGILRTICLPKCALIGRL